MSQIWKYRMTWDQRMGARITQMHLESEDWESMHFAWSALTILCAFAMDRNYHNLVVTCNKGNGTLITFDPKKEWPRPSAILP
jgi:hypothetical protein